MKTIILFFILALPAFSVCIPKGDDGTGTGHNRYYCPSTGDPTNDGANLKDFLDSAVWACGDTIILDSGASYLGKHAAGFYYPFVVPDQVCDKGERTHLVSTRAKELYKSARFTTRCYDYIHNDPSCATWPVVADIPKMAKLVAARGANQSNSTYVFGSHPLATRGWLIEGIAFSTDPDFSKLDHGNSPQPMVNISSGANGGTPGTPTPTWPTDYSEDVEFLHCLITTGEEETLGVLPDCKTIDCTLRGATIGFSVSGRNMKITESAVIGIGGFLPNSGSILSMFSVNTGGTGWNIGDTGHVTSGNDPARFTVTSTSGGAVTGITITHGGFLYGGYNGAFQVHGTSADTGGGSGFSFIPIIGNGSNLSITAATNEISPIVTVPGIAATLGIVAPAAGHCVDPVTSRPKCTGGCLGADHGCDRVTIEGFPSSGPWNDLNGVKYAIYNSANSVRIVWANRAEGYFSETNPQTHVINTTSAGAYPGGAKIRPSGESMTPQYMMVPGMTDNLQVTRSMIKDGEMTYFHGSGSTPTSYGLITASTFSGDIGTISVTVQAGGINGSAINDVIVFPTLTYSATWCQSSTCTGIPVQAAIIRGITGTYPNLVFTVRPWGPQGMDQPAIVGGSPPTQAMWRGNINTHVLFSENTIFRDQNAYPIGKGPMELKNSNKSLWDGNLTECMFVENKNQSPSTLWLEGMRNPRLGAVWAACKDSKWSHNIMGGCTTGHLNGADYEGTTTLTDNCHFEQNLSPESPAFAEYPYTSTMSGLEYGTASHNTQMNNVTTGMGQIWYVNYNVAINCSSTGSYNDLYQKQKPIWFDNIMSYGRGWVSTVPGLNCWPNEATAVHHNVLLNDDPAHSYTNAQINLARPGNTAVTDIPSIQFKCGSSCVETNPAGYELDPASPLKGTASDASDPGADIPELLDRFNGWSRQAGLLAYDMHNATWVNQPSAFHLTGTGATIRFRRFAPLSGCSLTLYTNPSRMTEHLDTSSGSKACNRSGNSEDSGIVTYVVGTVQSLTPGTTYHFKIVDGVRIMVGSFRTKPATGSTSWVTAITPGGTTTFTGPVGAGITIGAGPITVVALGRYCVAGNSGTHDVKLYTSGGTEIGSASVNMAGCTAGTFVYSSPTSIALSPGAGYFLASIESGAGDTLLDSATTVTTTSAAVDNESVYFSGSWNGGANPGHQYVGLSFKY